MKLFGIATLAFGIVVASNVVNAQSAKELSFSMFDTMAEIGAIVLAKADTEKNQIELAKKAVTGVLKDPGSAQFRNLYVVRLTKGMAVCGEVNAKNSYGGYTGFQHFVTGGIGAATRIERPASEDAANMFEWCHANRVTN